MQAGEKAIEYRYRFVFPDDKVVAFSVRLDQAGFRVLDEPKAAYPAWVRLGNCRCPNCPLDESQHPYCPAAAGVVDVIEFFKDASSRDTVLIEIESPARTYKKKGPLAMGVSALIGLQMAASGCPVLGRLRAMVLTHLPFANLDETLYRYLANYMLAQYFRSRRGLSADWEMKGLIDMARGIREVNRSFSLRLHSACREDAGLNALAHLDCFAENAAFTLEKRGLDRLERAFSAYWTQDGNQ